MNHPKRSLIFAHRGASKEAAENTSGAFDKALEYPIDGIETDVQLTRDEVPVLWHDRFLDKLGMPSKHIDNFDYAQLKSFDFTGNFLIYSETESKDERIMTLQEFLDAYRNNCRLLIEIKNREWEASYRHEIKVRKTMAMAAPAAGDTIMISSFDLDSLVYAHLCESKIPLIYNFEVDQTIEDARNVLAAQPFLYGLCLPIATIDAPMVELLRNHGKSIAAYTCNSDSEINKALELGVDILISDLPQKALQMRDG
ncbi:MAG: glycerophosphodiester phosphodiesterase [Pseudomonadota bacterium]